MWDKVEVKWCVRIEWGEMCQMGVNEHERVRQGMGLLILNGCYADTKGYKFVSIDISMWSWNL